MAMASDLLPEAEPGGADVRPAGRVASWAEADLPLSHPQLGRHGL
jgi:hypothetical protein